MSAAKAGLAGQVPEVAANSRIVSKPEISISDSKLRSVTLAAPELNKREGMGLQGHRTFAHAYFTNENVAPRLGGLR
jgi:hypothetical protein